MEESRIYDIAIAALKHQVKRHGKLEKTKVMKAALVKRYDIGARMIMYG